MNEQCDVWPRLLRVAGPAETPALFSQGTGPRGRGLRAGGLPPHWQ